MTVTCLNYFPSVATAVQNKQGDKLCAQHEQTALLTNGSHALERGEAYEEPERSEFGIRREELLEERP
jgi:hypothetical protein